MKRLGIMACLWAMVLGLGSTACGATKKPAVLFLSRFMHAYYGGAYLDWNMERLDKAGYRVAYHTFDEMAKTDADEIGRFDVVVFLTMPSAAELAPVRSGQAGVELRPEITRMYAQVRHLLNEGGGVMLFLEPNVHASKAIWPLIKTYGVFPTMGALADPTATLGVFNSAWFAYTTDVAAGPLTRGVKALWYPVAGLESRVMDFDALRNANTTPFRVDDSWDVLARTNDTTTISHLAGSDDPWILQKQFQQLPGTPAPLVAVRQGVEGSGRMAVCAMAGVYSNFVAGNYVYDGVLTGKGLKGKPSDLDRLLMNIMDWLGEPSVRRGRDTIAASLKQTYAPQSFKYPPPLSVKWGYLPDPVQFTGIVGAQSVFSGGKSTVAEYARTARSLGLDYVVFLEDYAHLQLDKWDEFEKQCASNSDDKLLLIPGIRIQDTLGIHYFGFRVGLKLPQASQLEPGSRRLRRYHSGEDGKPSYLGDGELLWAEANGGREGMATGNFRLAEKMPGGVPASDYNFLNPYISIRTYQNGREADDMLATYLKCAGRTEWVSPIAVNLVDSAEALKFEWESDHFRTVLLRNAGSSLNSLKSNIGERTGAFPPASYVTNGPKIEQWTINNHDFLGTFWDWTRYRWFLRFKVSSDAGVKEVRVMDGRRMIRRFLPGCAGTFEQTLVLTHDDMQDLILIVTDEKGRQAVSDEQWDKNQLLQLTWCSDRNNMLSYAALPSPDSPSGSTAENYPTPWNLEKGSMRERIVPAINMDRTRLPGFDGQPYWAVNVTAAPSIHTGSESEGGEARIDRDIEQILSSPDAAIQGGKCRLMYDKSVVRPHPYTRGPLVPMKLFNADVRYTTFSHGGYLPAPVIVEGTIKILKDLTFAENVPMGIQVMSASAYNEGGGYKQVAINHCVGGDYLAELSYEKGGAGGRHDGTFNPGGYVYFYPSPFGAVGVMSLSDGLSYRYSGKVASFGFETAGKTFRAGTELKYKLLVFVTGYDSPDSTEPIEQFRSQLGLGADEATSYQVIVQHGAIESRRYVLRVNGQGEGFSGEILLPADFPVSLPVMVDHLNDKWAAVLYEPQMRRFRPIRVVDGTAYCHRAPDERGGQLFIGHPFTLSDPRLWLSVVQTAERQVTLRIHNPTDDAIAATLHRTAAFDFVKAPDIKLDVPAGSSVERVIDAD